MYIIDTNLKSSVMQGLWQKENKSEKTYADPNKE